MISRLMIALCLKRRRQMPWRMSWRKAKPYSDTWVDVFYICILVACLAILLCLYQQTHPHYYQPPYRLGGRLQGWGLAYLPRARLQPCSHPIF